MSSIRVVSTHNCTRHHRNSTYFARCAWPGVDVLGQGTLAILTTCEHPRVFLIQRLGLAHLLRAELDVFGCGPGCSTLHELVAIDIDNDPAFSVKRAAPVEETA